MWTNVDSMWAHIESTLTRVQCGPMWINLISILNIPYDFHIQHSVFFNTYFSKTPPPHNIYLPHNIYILIIFVSQFATVHMFAIYIVHQGFCIWVKNYSAIKFRNPVYLLYYFLHRSRNPVTRYTFFCFYSL